MQRNLVAIFAVLAVLSSASGCSSGPARMESIVVAWSPYEHTALLYVAQDQDLISRNGLQVTSRKYDSGAGALNGMLQGEADLAVGVTEFPFVGRVLQKERIRTLASIAKSDITYLVARQDRGIAKVTDLKGKRVGTTIGTIAEFYLGRFLNLNGMNMQDVTLVDVKTPAEWVNAVVTGDIDAIATAQPYAKSAQERLGPNAVAWPAQSNQPLYALIIATDEWITKHPELVTRFLTALAQAEEYAFRNPTEARAIVQKRLDLDAAYMDTVWSQNQFALTLDQSLVLAMEDEARWMIKNNLTNERQVPNFLDYIYADGLATVKPEAVNIIR